MKVTAPQAITELRAKLQFEVGRHLYAVLGTYAQLDRFESIDLLQARDPGGEQLPKPVNINHQLLARMGDEELDRLVRNEPRYPTSVRNALNQELRSLIQEHLSESRFLIVKQVELLFAYKLDLTLFRTLASNRNHILLLLPGTRLGQMISLFHEADSRFHRTFPAALVAEEHLWELDDA